MHFSSNVNTAIGEKPTGLEALFSPLAGATEAVANSPVKLGQPLNNPQVMKRDINADEGCPSFTRFSPTPAKADSSLSPEVNKRQGAGGREQGGNPVLKSRGLKPCGLSERHKLFSPCPPQDAPPASSVNGKIICLVFNVAIEGTFEQTESIIRDIERLQPLLIVRDYQSTLAPTSTADAKGQVGSAIINTSFQLQALMPVSVELATQTSTSSAVTQHQNKRW